jgi:hypothetical protein
LIVLPRTRNSRRTRAIVSTPFIPHPPVLAPGREVSTTRAAGGQFWTLILPLRGSIFHADPHSEARFVDCLFDLLARGFPSPDATTGNYDLQALEAWQDRRSGLSASVVANMAKDASAVVAERLAVMRNG